MMKCEWILCPVCGSKTRNKIRKDTVLENYPLYCPKCRQERLIKVDNLKITVIKEPDGGRAYLENRPAENAGVFHKGDCPACAFDDWCHLCEVRPSAEEAAENFIASKTACHPAGYWVRDGNPLTHFLQEDNRMAYRVKAYTLREESTESGTRYFISFKDGQGKSHELEVSEQFFMEFRQMERRNRNLF